MALMDLKSDLSFYGKKGQNMNYKPNRDKTDTNFSADGLSTSNVLVYDNITNVFSRRQLQAADSFLIDDVTYSSRGFASRKTQLGGGSKFPIGPTGERHPFDKDPRTGFSADARYSDQYGVKFGDSGLADTYTANSPIDDVYDKLNLRDDAHNNSYIRQPYILRGIQRKVGKNRNEPQFWGVEGSSVGGQIDSALDLPRGGILANLERTAIDAARIGKFLISPKGLGFITKQIGYQLMNPISNTRIYNPLSLGSIAPMVHINRHVGTGFLEKKMPDLLGNIGSALDLQQSRLETLLKEDHNTMDLTAKDGKRAGDTWDTLSQTIGGPGSILGIGGTDYFKQHDTSFEAQKIAGLKLDTWVQGDGYHRWSFGPLNYVQTRGEGGVRSFDDIESSDGLKTRHTKDDKYPWPKIAPSRGGDGKSNKGGGRSSNTEKEKGLDYTLLPYDDIPARQIGTTDIIRTKDGKSESYTGKSNFGTNLDKLNDINTNPDKSLIDFKFKSDDNEITFKAYLGTLSDQFAPSWEGTADQGRADSRYQYSAFERSISLDFRVVVEQGKSEGNASPDGFKDIWNKLQNLGRMTHPVYGSEGFYGQKVDVTIGKLFNAIPMIITDLGFDWDNETPWEIDPDYQAPLYTNVIMSCIVLGKKRPDKNNKLYDITGLE